MRRCFRLAGLILMLLGIAGLAYSQDKKLPARDYEGVRIKIVDAGDANDPIESQILSKVNRRFREFKDITITDFEPDLIIHFLALTDRLRDGKVIGFTIAVIITEPIKQYEVNKLAATSSGILAQLRDQYASKEFFEDFLVRTWPSDGLDERVQSLVESIDVRNVEPIRKWLQTWKEKGIKPAK